MNKLNKNTQNQSATSYQILIKANLIFIHRVMKHFVNLNRGKNVQYNRRISEIKLVVDDCRKMGNLCH